MQFLLYFISADTIRYLNNEFIHLFLDYTQGSHYYCHCGNFKVPHFIVTVIIIIIADNFLHQRFRMVFHWIWVTTSLLKSPGLFSANGLMSRVFANGPGDRDSIPGRVIPKTQKMVLDSILLDTLLDKVRIKGKVEQSREWCSALPYTLVL